MIALSYENAMNHWKNGYLAWNPNMYSYYKKNFYIGLSVVEDSNVHPFYYDTDNEIEDRSIIYDGMTIIHHHIFEPKYCYYIKISSKETLDNLTESDYNEMIIDFEHKIKSYKIKNKINDISKDFE